MMFFVYQAISVAQVYGEVQYSIIVNIDYEDKKLFKMIFNQNESLAEEINIKTREKRLVKENNDGMLSNNIFGGRKNITPTFYYNNSKDFYFSEIIEDDVLIVKEDKFSWNWKLHSDTKKIGNFECQKATIRFRGRNYIAWFAKQVAVSFGPWKLHGLSGLILEAYDENYYLHAVATKVVLNDAQVSEIKVEDDVLASALDIEAYLKKRKEVIQAVFARISSRLPKGTSPLVLDEDCEDCNAGSLELFHEKP
jgi:GLPGLI family protein